MILEHYRRHSFFYKHGSAIAVGVALGLLCLLSPLLALVAVSGIAFAVVALKKPILLCYVMIPAIVLTSGMERGRLIPHFKPSEVGLVAAVGVVLVILLIDKRKRIADLRYGAATFVVLIPWVTVVPLVYYVLHGTVLSINGIFWLIAPLQYFLLFLLYAIVPETQAERRRLVILMLVCSAVVAVIGLAQAAHVGFVINLLNRWYPSGHLEAINTGVGRVTSLVGAWNALGILMATSIVIGWSILASVKALYRRIIVMGSIAVCGICLVASGSFAGIGGLVLGIGLIELLYRRGVRMVLPLLVGVLVSALLIIVLYPVLEPLLESRLGHQFQTGESLVPHTLSFRFVLWRELFFPAIREHFPWPVHPTIPANYGWSTEESQYVMLLFRMGVFGLLGHLGWVGMTLFWLYRRLRKADGLTRAIIVSTITLFVVLSIQGLTNDVFTWVGTIDYVWILLGLVSSSTEAKT